MDVVEVAAYGEPVRVADRPRPEPGPGEVRVRLAAAAINPADWLTAAGVLEPLSQHIPLPAVLGWDLAGTVHAAGPDVDLRSGEVVAAMSPWFEAGNGTFAEYVVLRADHVARIPEGADLIAAATVPLNAQTARQAVDLLELTAGQTLLIIGGSGGVGGYAIQLAAADGAQVITVGSSRDEARLRELGAVEVLPRTEDLVAAVRARFPEGVDAVFDAVPAGPHTIGAVRDGGAFVTTLDPAIPAAERDVRVKKVSVEPRRDQLEDLLAAFAAGRLQTRVAETFPLREAATAFKLASSGGLAGKVVLVP